MRSIQNIAVLLVIGIFPPLIAAEPKEVAKFSSYDFNEGKRYDFSIQDNVLLRTPVWRADEEFPPLSPRKAEALAREQLKKLVKEPEKWSRSAIELREIEGARWIYVVHFDGFHPPGVIDGTVSTMSLIVLMDGSVIEPKILPYGGTKKDR